MNTDLALWALFVAIGLGTFALRVSFIQAYGRLRIPPLLSQALAYVPASVLAALVFPAVTHPGGEMALDPGNARLLAAALAALVAWRTKSILLTLASGMGMLWLQQSLM